MKLGISLALFGLIIGAVGIAVWQLSAEEFSRSLGPIELGIGIVMAVLGGRLFLLGLIRVIIKR